MMTRLMLLMSMGLMFTAAPSFAEETKAAPEPPQTESSDAETAADAVKPEKALAACGCPKGCGCKAESKETCTCKTHKKAKEKACGACTGDAKCDAHAGAGCKKCGKDTPCGKHT